jgi:UDP-N-acetylmuramyl-tripeptide synthetase
MTAYFAAKKTFFTGHLKNDGAALVLLSEAMDITEPGPDWGARLEKELLAGGRFRSWHQSVGGIPLLTAGRKRGDLRVRRAEISLAGIETELMLPDDQQLAVTSPLTGDFNLDNILAAVGGGWLAGIPAASLVRGIAELRRVPGRLEKVENPNGAGHKGCQIFVDYAHTPDALARVLATLRHLTSGRLVLVFGCGGDRDRGKRPLMGEVAGRGADVVLLTSDNPRSESPEAIMAEIERGLYPEGMALLPRGRAEQILTAGGRGFDLIVSRRAAIRTAIRFARANDVVLLAGKGHEDYQIIGGRRDYFDDRREAALQMAVIKR